MPSRPWIVLTAVAVLCAPARAAHAQERPAPIVEFVVGQSGFIDEAWDYFTTIGGGVRWFVTPRLAVGPEIAYMSGEFDALETSHLSVTGNVTFDFVQERNGSRVVPYVAAGAGYLRQRTLVGRGPGVPGLAPFTSGEGTFSGGIGARVAISSRIFVAPEFRLGWEPTTRITVMVGLRPR